MALHKESIFRSVKRGIYSTVRYPWGTTRGQDGRPQNTAGIFAAHSNFFTTAGQSIQALPRNEQRRFMQIQNMSAANDIVFAWGTSASLNDGVTLTPGQVEIFDVAVPVDQLNIFCVAAGQRVALAEGL